MTDIVKRLCKPSDGEDTMRAWDSWRKYIKDGGGASWPRDAFESLLGCIDEEREEAAKEIMRLRKALSEITVRTMPYQDDHEGWPLVAGVHRVAHDALAESR